MNKIAFALIAVGLVACSGSDPSTFGDDTVDGGAQSDAELDSGTPSFNVGDGALESGALCDPPDMLIVLDRSDSMSGSAGKGPDGGVLPSKWKLAVSAVDAIMAAPTDTKLRFGLEVFPKVAGSCGTGNLLVPIGLGVGSTIAKTLATTGLAGGTPIGGALKAAQTTLASTKVKDREQYVVLVTDGGETCGSAPPLAVVQALAASGVKTFVVGFGAGVSKAQLNDLACGGLTASSFATACTKTNAGYASNGGTAELYYSAADGDALEKALAKITGGVCCGCTAN